MFVEIHAHVHRLRFICQKNTYSRNFSIRKLFSNVCLFSVANKNFPLYIRLPSDLTKKIVCVYFRNLPANKKNKKIAYQWSRHVAVSRIVPLDPNLSSIPHHGTIDKTQIWKKIYNCKEGIVISALLKTLQVLH